MQLTEEQIARFDRDGFLVLPDLLTPAEVRQLQHETDHYHETLTGSLPAGVDVTWEPNSRPPRVQQVLNAECLSQELGRIIRSDRLRSVIEPLLGPDVGLFHVKFIMKSPEVGGPVPWHQDFVYWTGQADAPLQLNCMVYLDDADDRNGCLQVLGGSQRSGLEEHSETTKGSFVHELDVSGLSDGIVSLPGTAGTGILFGPLLKHASPPNRSAKPRRSFTAVYAAGSGQSLREIYWTRQHDVAAFAGDLRMCPAFAGEGPHGGQCDGAYRRRELWKLATAAARGVSGAWVEVVMSPSVGESLEWFAAHRPHDVPLVRFDTYLPSEVSSPRVDIHRPSGLTGPSAEDVRARVPGSLALLHLEGGSYFGTRKTLDAFSACVRQGTVLVFDRFYGADGSPDEIGDALWTAARAHGWDVEARARSDRALTAVITAIGTAGALTVRRVTAWTPTVQGIEITGAGPRVPQREADPPEQAANVTSETTLRRARRAAGSIKRALGFVGEWERFFPVDAIPAFVGDGPRRTMCPTHARRRELWRYAVTLVQSTALPWCEFGVGEGESLDWFLLHKPAENVMFGFDTFEGIPEPWLGQPVGHWKSAPYQSSRTDLVIVRAPFKESVSDQNVRARLAPGVGLVHVDCDLYRSTKTVLEGIREFLRPETVLIFDEFYGYGGWQQCEAGAFREFVEAERVTFEYVARSDFQVAVRILSLGAIASWSVRPLCYAPVAIGIDIATGPSRLDALRSAFAQLRG